MTSATGYSFTRVADTTVSGSALYSALSGEDVRQLQFASATSSAKKTVTLAASGGTAYSFNAVQWMNAAVNTQLVDTSTVSSKLTLGPDAASQASYYINLFNIHSGDTRILKITQTIAAGGSTTIGNSTSTTSTYVQCAQDGGSLSDNALLFNLAANLGSTNVQADSGNLAGRSRLVLVSNPYPDSGDRIRFNVLSGSM